ncbi:rRNA accumulation- protein [Rhizoclosmatium sp. JEL0117]|nr:rRNA accumulation- protein [Rhizoclosmatium hyalinum]KAJ3298458.1 rRNA accumulation- protein [Rhizoclosmatium sp. JEL0117]
MATCFVSQQHMDLFKESIHYVFLRWTALQLAIEHGMGGTSTLSKVAMLGDYIVDFFSQNGLRIDPTDLEENLIDFFAESFQVELEDGSAPQISKLICQLFREIGSGDMTGFNKARELASRVTGAASQSRRVRAEGEEDDDDDSDDDSEDGMSNYGEASGSGAAGDMEMDEAPSTPAPRQEPIIDEDGFELVQQKGRRRR